MHGAMVARCVAPRARGASRVPGASARVDVNENISNVRVARRRRRPLALTHATRDDAIERPRIRAGE